MTVSGLSFPWNLELLNFIFPSRSRNLLDFAVCLGGFEEFDIAYLDGYKGCSAKAALPIITPSPAL